jgi:squalene-hopene/tetraprenyl-beta-curcumene cyclase
VRRAVAFLKRMQCPNGAFWGRWLTNFLSGTAFVISGLAAVHENLEEEWVQRAIGWLLTRQRADGAWGETVASYRDPSLAGSGPASPPLTGLVITALIDAGLSDMPAVTSGVRYLLEAQSWDGTWADADHLAPLVPPDAFYAYGEAAKYYPLEALGRFRSSGRR